MKRAWRAAGLLVAALVLGVCATLLGKPPGDHLIVDPGMFGGHRADPYEAELASLLLPVGSRELEMVWVPSWEPEGAAAVAAGGLASPAVDSTFAASRSAPGTPDTMVCAVGRLGLDA